MNILIYILKVIVIMGMTAGWNEGRENKSLPPRYWEKKFEQADSAFNAKVDSIRMVMK